MRGFRILACVALIAAVAHTAAQAELSPAQCRALERSTSDLAARLGDLLGEISALDLSTLKERTSGSAEAGAVERLEAARAQLIPALAGYAQSVAALSQHMEACSRR